MRKAIFLFFLLLGVGAGYLPARNDDWGLRIVMMAVGALFGGAIGGGLSQVGKRKKNLNRFLEWARQVEISLPITGAMKAIHSS